MKRLMKRRGIYWVWTLNQSNEREALTGENPTAVSRSAGSQPGWAFEARLTGMTNHTFQKMNGNGSIHLIGMEE